MAGMYGCFKGRNTDSADMASGPPDVMTSQEPAEVQEECSGKKKSKFQTFKKFFARKKRKEPSAAGADAGLKGSQSSDNISKTSENNTLTRAEKDKGSGSKISLGSKALSHDSVFVSDSSEANEALGASQDSIHGKVKSLQLQLKQAIRLGSPPSLMCVKRTEDAGTMSEDDGLPCSPPEYTTLHAATNQAQRNSAISLEGLDSEDDQLSSSRAVSPLVVPGDFSQPASPFGCLDNSAAKHKLGLRYKACNKRKPVSRLEGKAEGDSAVEEMLTASTLEAEASEEREHRTEDVSGGPLKPQVEREEEEEEEDEEEKEKPQHSRQSLLGDKEEREEGEDESEAEQDVSHSLDTSCPPEPSLSEEEASDAQPLPSSKPSSRTSSLDSPRATPESPAGPREYLLDPPGICYGAEPSKVDSDQASEGEEDGVQENREEEEEESSFLQEVLSSLKTPLASCSLAAEDVALEMTEEAEEEEKEEVEIEEGEDIKVEEEEEEDESVGYQAAPSSSVLPDETTEEEEEVVAPSWQEEEVVEEEVKGGEEAEEEEEDRAVEGFTEQDPEEEGQKEEVRPEEDYDMLTRQTISQAEEEGGEEEVASEGEEEEAIEVEKEPEVVVMVMEDKGREKREEDDDREEEGEERVEEAEDVMEEEKDEAEEMTEMFADAQDDVAMPVQEAGDSVALGEDSVFTTKHTSDEEIPADLGGQALVQEEQEDFKQDSGDDREDGEERAEEGVEVDLMDQKSDQEEDMEVNRPDADQSEQERVETASHLDMEEVGKDPSEATEQAVCSKPPSLSLPESHHETPSQEPGAISPSKTSTATLHINLASPSSEKATSLFDLSPTAADRCEGVAESSPRDVDATQPSTASADEEQADTTEEEEEQCTQEQAAAPPAPVEETANQPPCSSDQSKVRFTITPAWQRSQSLTPPSSPPVCVSSSSTVTGPRGEAVEAAAQKDPAMKAEPASPAKVEVVLSPGRVRNVGSATAKPHNSAPPAPVRPQPSAAASTEESSVVVEGNPDNPFGVRLRKTTALLRFSSEEENAEPAVESPTQTTGCKVDSPQPVSVKPSVCQPISNKPALPKKPEVHGDSGGKLKRPSEPAAGRGVSAGSDSPSWISVAKQKQKIYKENSLEEITVKKDEQERKSSLPTYVSSAASREHSNKTAEPTGKVSPLEISKPSVSVEKEARRALSPPTPVPPQPSKPQSLPCPVAPKPQVPSATAKHPPQANPPQRSLSPPTPVPVAQKSLSCTSPPSLSKTAISPKTPTVTSPPLSSRTAPEKPASRAPGLSGQTASSQRGLPPAALPQDEPPWMALAKKKAKAWSEMPQIVQ